MEFLASYSESRNISPQVIQYTNGAFAPFLEKNRSKIESTTRKTFQYGDTPRHQLDIYYPPEQASAKPPILFFFYGGGFFAGDRVKAAPEDLWFKNIGAFFASRGILTVIPDYRLVTPGKDTTAVFPDPISDASKAVQYIVENGGHGGDIDNIFISGHSAGGNIAATLFLYNKAPIVLPTHIAKGVKGLISWGGGFHFNGGPMLPPPIMATYFGTTDLATIHKVSPYGLLEEATTDVIKALPPALFIVAEQEPAAIMQCNEDFIKLWDEKTGNSLQLFVAQGHNHPSMPAALSSGEGEDFGVKMAKFIKINSH